MNKKKLLKTGIILILSGIVIGFAVVLFLLNMPHKNIPKSKVEYTLSSSELVNEYLLDQNAANEKYLNSDGNSKVLLITGTVANVSTNYNKHLVVLLKENNDPAGVNVIFEDTKLSINDFVPGSVISAKGVIRLGASYDNDMEMYEHAIIENSILINKH